MAEPQRLSKILPGVMCDIRGRCEMNPVNRDFKPRQIEHRRRVLNATADFMSCTKQKKQPNRIKAFVETNNAAVRF